MTTPVLNFPILESPLKGALTDALQAYIQTRYKVPQMEAETKIKQAELPYAAQNAKANSLYKEAMADYLRSPAKQSQGLSALGKLIMEQHSLNSGSPDSQSPDDEVNNQYNLLRLKTTTDSQARQKNLYASNIEKTIGYINQDDLAHYSGIKGSAKLKKDEFLSAIGKATEEYKSFAKSAQAASTLAKQVRQFYGDSIQPEMLARLEHLSNPTSWQNDPELTKELFTQTVDILHNELGTYRQAMKSTRPYEEDPEDQRIHNTASSILAKTIKIPSYIQTDDQFKEWFNSQDNIVKSAVMKKHGRR